MNELIARLKKRLEEDRCCALNNDVAYQLLKPELDKFNEAQKNVCPTIGYNVYAVKLAVDHRNNAKKDHQYVADLEKVINILETLDLNMIANALHDLADLEVSKIHGDPYMVEPLLDQERIIKAFLEKENPAN